MPPRKVKIKVPDSIPQDYYESTDNSSINNQSNQVMNVNKIIISGIILIMGLLLTFFAIEVVRIEGNQLGVKETWAEGVSTNILQPKTYFLFPGWSQDVIKYDASSQVFVMNDKGNHTEGTKGRKSPDAYLVQSQEGQDMKISLNLRWRIDPTKLVQIHKTVRNQIEEKIIRPVVMRVVKDKATKMKAIDAYSGEGLVKLQNDIQQALSGKDPNETNEMADRGVVVENFVIEHIELDPAYIVEIKGKQIATQKTLRSKEEQIAAEAAALVAKSIAQADYNTQEVQAKRDAIVKVTAAQASNESAIIAAKAEAQKLQLTAEGEMKKMELEANGKRAAMIATAEGTLAMGKAEAQAKELLLKAWAVPGAESFVKVEVSKNLATAFGGIKGYLPEKMTINTFTDNFLKGLEVSTGNVVAGPPVAR